MEALPMESAEIKPTDYKRIGELSELPHLMAAFEELDSCTSKMQRLGKYLLNLTGLQFSILLSSAIASVVTSLFPPKGWILFPLLSICVTFLVIPIFGVVDSVRRRGNALFALLSGELQTLTVREKQRQFDDARYSGEAPYLKLSTDSEESKRSEGIFAARLSLQSWATAEEVPLFPGRFGPTLYALVNVLATATTVIMFRSVIRDPAQYTNQAPYVQHSPTVKNNSSSASDSGL